MEALDWKVVDEGGLYLLDCQMTRLEAKDSALLRSLFVFLQLWP